jgi:NhaP-type Na+/H+ or K+/H+ antiporter
LPERTKPAIIPVAPKLAAGVPRIENPFAASERGLMNEAILREFAAIGAMGVGAQWLAWRYNVPAIALLLLSGLLLGPFTGFVQPRHDFGPIIEPLVSSAVAVILFEGGLSLNFVELRETSTAVRRAILVGGPLIAAGGAVAAHFVGGMSWPTSIVLAAILVVTGPTVIAPLLRGARLDKRVASVLRWESIVNDPIGAILAALALEIMAYAHAGEGAGGLALRALGGLSFSLGAGFLAGRALANIYERGLAPEHLKAPILLASVLALFVAADAIFDEAGLLAVTTMGITLANLRFASLNDLRRFKEAITTILVSSVFIVLTAQVDLAALRALDWRAALFILLLLFVLRPAALALATSGAGLSWRERLFVGWIAPRGIVAVTVSALFGDRLAALGAPDAELLSPVVFAVVFTTIILHGFSLRPLARALGLSASGRKGLLIVGASPWSVALAEKIRETELPVLVVDADWRRLQTARMRGVPSWRGEILSSEAHLALDLDDYSHLLAATRNEAYDTLVCQEFAPEFGRDRVFQLGSGREDETPRGIHFTIGGRSLTQSAMDFDTALRRLGGGWVFTASPLSEQFDYEAWRERRPAETELLFWVAADGALVVAQAHPDLAPAAGAILIAFGPKPAENPAIGP